MDIKLKQFLNNNILRFLQYLISMVYDLVYQKIIFSYSTMPPYCLSILTNVFIHHRKKNKTNRT